MHLQFWLQNNSDRAPSPCTRPVSTALNFFRVGVRVEQLSRVSRDQSCYDSDADSGSGRLWPTLEGPSPRQANCQSEAEFRTDWL